MSTPVQATPKPELTERAMTVPEIDVVLKHWSAKLEHAKDEKQRTQWMNVINAWLEARTRLVETQALERLYRKPK